MANLRIGACLNSSAPPATAAMSRGDQPDDQPVRSHAGMEETIAASTPTIPDAMPVEPGTASDAADSIDARM